MGSAPAVLEALRERALRDDPACVMAWADIAAWDRAEGPASAAAAAAIQREDFERWIPGLPARRTYKVLGRTIVAVVVVDTALSFLPPSDTLDTLDTLIRYGTAILGVTVAAWSLLSEVRGWDGSDAATWFLKARIDRIRKKLEARRLALRDTLIAVGDAGLVVYRSEGGQVSREAFALDGSFGLSLDVEASHMALNLTTSAGISRFDWLPRDAGFEAAVARLTGAMRAREGGVEF